MRFIRKKNFLEGEELLYKPVLHWMFVVKHMVLSLPVFIVLTVLWVLTESYTDPEGMVLGLAHSSLINLIIWNLFLAGAVVILLVFVWKIFLFIGSEFGITNRRLLIKKGILRLKIMDIPVDRIESIYCTQGLMGRLFGYGNLFITGIGGSVPVFCMAARPYAIRRKIAEVIEKNKTITVVHGDLPRAAPAPRAEPVPEDEPVYRYGTFVRMMPGK